MRKGNKRINFKIISVIVITIILFASIVGINSFFNSSYTKKISVVSGEEEKLKASEEQIDVGRKGYITSAVILGKTTGTGPFDSDDEPGNDSSESNNIVRSFDKVTWTIENTMSIKPGITGNNLYGGIICVEAELPASCANMVKWDVDSMRWAENSTVSADGRTLYAEYSLSDEQITIPGKQNIVLVLKVQGAKNGLELKPKFKMYLYGNNDGEKCSLEDTETTYVSAFPKMNLKLVRNSICDTIGHFDFVANNRVESANENTKYGRLQGYGVAVQVYNDSAEKELKGLEIPTGDITFDIVLNEIKSSVDVTNQPEYTPVLWDYNGNKSGAPSRTGYMGRNMYYDGIGRTCIVSAIPYNSGGGDYSCYNGGNFTIVQDNVSSNIYHVTVKDYKFHSNYVFPPKNSDGTIRSSVVYGKNIGCISALSFQTLLQFPENETVAKINNKVTVTNFRYTSVSGLVGTTDKESRDNVSNAEIDLHPKSSFSKAQYFHKAGSTAINATAASNLSKSYTGGDAYLATGNKFILTTRASTGNVNDDVMERYNVLQKFDDEGFEPLEDSNSNSAILVVATNSISTRGNLVTLYAAKPDKTGWIDENEMISAKEENLIYFDSYSALKQAGYICVGVLHENTNIKGYRDTSYYIGLTIKVKDTAEVGKVYATVNNLRVWLTNQEFTWLGKAYTYDAVNGLVYTNVNYPTPDYSRTTTSYTKTAYDENMKIIQGTPTGVASGNSLLVVGANLKVAKSVTDLNDSGNKKVNYDIGKNEVYVNYQIQPTVENTALPTNISGITLKIKDTIPSGLEYVPGTSNYGEPTITHNDDGSTTLVWYIYNVTVNNPITPITYKAHIDEESPNGTKYESIVVAEEVVGNGENSKIGTGTESDRTAKNTIQIINMASYAFYKVTSTPIIELNGDIHYKLTAINKTDYQISNFKLLDILPYNGDGRGTSYSGTYTVSRIDAKQVNTTNDAVLSNNNLTLKTSNANTARTATIEDANLGNGWTTTTFGSTLNRELKALYVNGSLDGRVRLELDIYLKTNNNKSEDKYVNIAHAKTSQTTEAIQTVLIENNVVKRYIEGTIWFDSNKDGLFNTGEETVPNVSVTLYNQNGTIAKDNNNNNVPAITTNNTGYYKFDNLSKGNYYVQISYPDAAGEKEITAKGVGSNKEINSKFNSNRRTDVITTLNSIDAPIIYEKNVNAGITYLDTSVLVHHYIINPDGTRTTNKVPLNNGTEQQDVTINGIIHDNYTAVSVTNLAEQYELDENNLPSNATGEMTKAQKVVTFYYKLKKYSYEVNYYEKLSNGTLTTNKIKTTKTVPNIVWGTEVLSSSEIININGYNYSSADKDKIVIKIDLSQNIINLYYTKRTDINYTVNYLEKGSNKVIDTSKTVPNQTYLDKIDTSREVITIYGYNYDSIDPNTLEIDYNEANNIINIYYTKKSTSVLVRHLEQGTNTPLGDEVTIPGLVFDEYETEADADVLYKYSLVGEPTNKNGTMTEEQIIVTYYYSKKSGVVNVRYVDMVTDRELISHDEIVKTVDETYEASPKEIASYKYSYDSGNTTGIVTVEPKDVIFYYAHDAVVNVHFVEKGTNKVLADDEVLTGVEGEKYKAESKTIKGYNISVADLPQNAEGTMTRSPITVVFYYEAGTALVEIHHLNNFDDKDIVDVSYITGLPGEDYSTEPLDMPEYDLVEEKMPENASGLMTEEKIIVNYYYAKKSSVTIKYLNRETGEELAKTIVIPGYEGDEYHSSPVNIEDYILVSDPKNKDGLIPNNPLEIIYYYSLEAAGVTERHIDEKTNEILYTEFHPGAIGDEYNIESRKIENYQVNEARLPNNKNGYMSDEPIVVTYYYNYKTPITVEYIDRETEEKLIEDVHNSGFEGENYTTEVKTFTDYKLVKEPENKDGVLTRRPVNVKYYYAHDSEGVIVHYVDEETKEEIVEKEIIPGQEGDSYEAKVKTIENYRLNSEKYPINSKGKMTIRPIDVYYFYTHTYKVIIRYVDIDTDEIIEEVIKEGISGEEYHSSPKSFSGYQIVEEEMPENKDGIIGKETIIVTYYYKVATNSNVVPGVIIPTNTVPDIVINNNNNNDIKVEQYDSTPNETVVVIGDNGVNANNNTNTLPKPATYTNNATQRDVVNTNPTPNKPTITSNTEGLVISQNDSNNKTSSIIYDVPNTEKDSYYNVGALILISVGWYIIVKNKQDD